MLRAFGVVFPEPARVGAYDPSIDNDATSVLSRRNVHFVCFD